MHGAVRQLRGVLVVGEVQREERCGAGARGAPPCRAGRRAGGRPASTRAGRAPAAGRRRRPASPTSGPAVRPRSSQRPSRSCAPHRALAGSEAAPGKRRGRASRPAAPGTRRPHPAPAAPRRPRPGSPARARGCATRGSMSGVVVEGLRQRQAEATRELLVSIARERFTEQGYAATSIEDIVQRAGVAKGALYHHFSGKAPSSARCTRPSWARPSRRSWRPRSRPGTVGGRRAGLSAFLDACLERRSGAS